MQRMNKTERAKIFMPFAALKGFEEALREKEKIVVEKKELNEEEIDELNKKINLIKKNQMVKIVYFCDGEYVEIQGLISKIDKVFKNLTVVNKLINFENILTLDIIE